MWPSTVPHSHLLSLGHHDVQGIHWHLTFVPKKDPLLMPSLTKRDSRFRVEGIK